MSDTIITFTTHETLKLRAYPTVEQVILFWKTIGCKRLYWNCMHEDHEFLYWSEHLNVIPRPAEYRDEFPFLGEVDSHALINVMMDYQNAWRSHFKHPNLFGEPTWKKKSKERRGTCSYETNNLFQKRKDGSVRETIYFSDATHMRLPKMGDVEIVRHQLPKKNAKLKTVTFEREADGKFYLCLVYEYEIECRNFNVFDVSASEILTLDMSCPSFYVDHDGHTPLDDDFDMERYPKQRLIELEKRISKKQHELSRREYGSNNYEHFLTNDVNELWSDYRHRKMDFLQKLSSEIANRYKVVIVEDLNLKAMGNHGFHLGTSVYRNSYSTFLSLLEYKLERRGGRLVKVSRWFSSSKRCSSCGHVKESLELSERTYVCEECGAVLGRDVNAARNLWVEGVRLLCAEVGVVLDDGLLSYDALRSSWSSICKLVTGGTPGFGCGAEQRPSVRLESVSGDASFLVSVLECGAGVSGLGEEATKERLKLTGGDPEPSRSSGFSKPE